MRLKPIFRSESRIGRLSTGPAHGRDPQELAPFLGEPWRVFAVVAPASKGLSLSRSR